MAVFERARTSLANLEERLRRKLNLVGLIQADFNPEAIPVVIVEDATAPGCNITRGRHFSGGDRHTDAAGGTGFLFLAQSEVTIDHLTIGNEAAVAGMSFAFAIRPPGLALPFAVATQRVAFSELVISSTDYAPVLFGFLDGGAVAGLPIGTVSIGAGRTVTIPLSIHLPVGACFGWFTGGSANVFSWMLKGRVF